MNTLRQALNEYLSMRRALGFKLHDAGKGLSDFVSFMERHRASYITQPLALAWAKQPSGAQPAEWARRLSWVRLFARYRSATDPRTHIPPPGLLPYRPQRARPYLDLPLPVGFANRLRVARWRSAQPQTRRRRPRCRRADGPRNQVWQIAAGSPARVDSQGAG
jgi:hypothetical protein